MTTSRRAAVRAWVVAQGWHVWRALVGAVRSGRKWYRENRLALFSIFLGLFGWGLLTDALAEWLGGAVWQVSLGLLCLSLFGWRFAYIIATQGIYTLLKSKRGSER